MAKVANLSDYCFRKSVEFRCRAAAAYRGQNIGLGNECNDIAERLEIIADYARPRLVAVAVPISQTSFGGAA